jgi:hypothetical protein
MREHAVVMAGGGPTGLMLAGELALAGVDVAIVERRVNQEIVGSRAGGLGAHARGFRSAGHRRAVPDGGQIAQVTGFAVTRLDISDFPTRHNYGLALRQKHIERILAGWVGELPVVIYRGCELTGFVQNASGVTIELSDASEIRAAISSAAMAAAASRKTIAGEMSGLALRYDLGEGHPLLGRRMPDLDLATPDGAIRVFALLRNARPVLLNLGAAGSLDIAPWSGRVRLVQASYGGPWELPTLGAVSAPSAVLIRPDGYVAWVGEGTQDGLHDAMITWFGPPG